ncbi:MAG: hypothetical protein V3U81_01405 [Candidatus Binatia bacterium]
MINSVPEAMGKVHLSPKKPMASKLAKRGDVLRKGDALEIPTRVADVYIRTCVTSGVITPLSIKRSAPVENSSFHRIKGPRIEHTITVMVMMEMEMAVVGEASFRPTRAQI